MTLLKELFALNELKNHMGETEYSSYKSWKAAVKKAVGDSPATFIGDSSMDEAQVKDDNGKMRGVGEWDGSVGVVYKKPAGLKMNEGRAMDDIAIGGTVIYKSIHDKCYKMSKARRKNDSNLTVGLQNGDTVQTMAIVSTDSSDWSQYKDKMIREGFGIKKPAGLKMNELKNHMDETEYTAWDSWRKACRKAHTGVTFEGDEDIAQAMMDDIAVGEWDGSVGVVYKKPAGTKVVEGRGCPSWFKNGAKVKLRSEYADKNPQEVFTLSNVDDEKGDGKISDDDGKGWTVKHFKVYPANLKTEPVDESFDGGKRAFKRAEMEFELSHEDRAEKAGNRSFEYGIDGKVWKKDGKPVSFKSKATAEKAIENSRAMSGKNAKAVPLKESDEKLTTAKAESHGGEWLVKFTHCPSATDKRELSIRSVKAITSGQAIALAKAKLPKELQDCAEVESVKMMSEPSKIKEDDALQGLGKTLSGKAAPVKETPAKETPPDESPVEDSTSGPSDTEVTGDADDQDGTAEFKVGDVVKTLVGPHKGEAHNVTKVMPDGRLELKPKDIEGTAIKYRNGGIVAKPDQVVLAESIIHGTRSLLRTITIDLSESKWTPKKDDASFNSSSVEWKSGYTDYMNGQNWSFPTARLNSAEGKKYRSGWDEAEAAKKRMKEQGKVTEARSNDDFMPLSYGAKKGHTIEAYGRKGMANSKWRKMFKNSDALSKWCEDNDATVEGQRELDDNEKR